MGLTVEDRSIKAEDGWPLEATLFRGDRPRMVNAAAAIRVRVLKGSIVST